MLSLLLIEDDPILGQGMQIGLQQRDFLVEWVKDGLVARRQLRHGNFDCVLLDLQLPGMDGEQLLREWRKSGNTVPVLIITARDAISDRVSGLDDGADDYVVKPVSIDELVARVRAVYRRKGGAPVSELKHAGVTLDPIGHTVRLREAEVALPSAEFKILQTLMEHGRRVSTREYLERTLYGYDGARSNTIEVHIHGLRAKFGKSFIKTVRGVGYILA